MHELDRQQKPSIQNLFLDLYQTFPSDEHAAVRYGSIETLHTPQNIQH